MFDTVDHATRLEDWPACTGVYLAEICLFLEVGVSPALTERYDSRRMRRHDRGTSGGWTSTLVAQGPFEPEPMRVVKFELRTSVFPHVRVS